MVLHYKLLGVAANDGATCPFTVQMQKTVAPDTIPAGGTVTYTYVITNQNTTSFNGVNFSDTLDDGRTYVAGTLNVDPALVGTPNSFGGTNSLQINNLTLPGRSVTTITVDVLVARTTPAGTIFNQAQLNNIPIGFGGPTVLSDFSPTGPRSDPTPLVVTPAVATDPKLLLVKRITAINGQSNITNNGQNLNAFNDDPNSTDDNNSNWPTPLNTYLRGAFETVAIKLGDIVEYTIYIKFG